MPITTTPSGGPQGEFSTYTPIYSTTFSSAASSITFSNIPTTFTDLVVSIGGNFSADISAGIYFNGDTGSNYAVTRMWGNGTSAQSSSSNGSTQIAITTGNGSTLSTYTVNVMNYSNTTTYKPVLGRASQDSVSARIGTWRSTSPITSMTLLANGGNFAVGTVVTVYGIKAAAPAPKATGGDVITTDGTYWYHAFKNTGVFDVKQSLTADVLVVAGGGGGSSKWGGGGGAGGLRCLASQSLTPVGYTVTVGAGGGGGSYLLGYVAGNSGNNSSFSSISTTGGGGGGSPGKTGGSGGGGATYNQTGGAGNAGGYSPVEGYAGGNTPASAYQGAGGGGAGGVGSNAPAQQWGGAGGPGTNSYNSITFTSWLTATGTGVSGYLAGGGGGGGETANGGSSGGAGGSGGGGRGGNNNEASGVAGTANTGGGGGGGANDNSSGASGGSGLVIVRYAV